MIHKTVKLYTNRITVDLQPIIDYTIAYNLSHGVQLTVTTEAVNVTGYTSSEFAQIRTGINYCILLGSETLFTIDPAIDINVFVFDQNEWKTSPGSPYPLKSDTPTSDTIVVNGKPYINLGIYSPLLNQSEIVLCHELMHAYGKEAVAAGFPFEDCMDSMIVDGVAQTYYLNDQPNNPNSNFINQWERLISCGYFKALEDVVFPPKVTMTNPSIQQSTLDIITGFEGFRSDPYQDSVGVWTIGIGFTTLEGQPVRPTTPAMTLEQADAELKVQLAHYANAVTTAITVPITQNQFDACCSLCYNIGTGEFASSTVVRDINAGNIQGAADGFLLWDIPAVLIARREKERALFLS